jgi:hypothetical protein
MREIKVRYIFKHNNDILLKCFTLDEIDYNGLEWIYEKTEEYYKTECNCLNESCNHCECGGWILDYEIISKDLYAGCEDKNDIEIYEGDFVKFYDHALKENIIREIFWDEEQCEFGFRRSNELFHKQFSNKFEVVGNIHKNPELKEG